MLDCSIWITLQFSLLETKDKSMWAWEEIIDHNKCIEKHALEQRMQGGSEGVTSAICISSPDLSHLISSCLVCRHHSQHNTPGLNNMWNLDPGEPLTWLLIFSPSLCGLEWSKFACTRLSSHDEQCKAADLSHAQEQCSSCSAVPISQNCNLSSAALTQQRSGQCWTRGNPLIRWRGGSWSVCKILYKWEGLIALNEGSDSLN